jgi:Co/Zn/Cd efflux system component
MSVWLCTRNDCIANIAVMIAGAGVWASGTPWPDIAVAAIIAWLGLSSAVRIIRQARGELSRPAVFSSVPAEGGPFSSLKGAYVAILGVARGRGP